MGPRGHFYPYLYHFNYIVLLEIGFMQVFYLCDTPKPGGPIDYRQPAETCVSHIMRPIHE